jgi:GTPase SAR1 family protein
MSSHYSIAVCGASRVGKSTLINTFVSKEVSNTSNGLNSCTKKIEKYTLKHNIQHGDDLSKYTITLWDTPGIELWTENEVGSFLSKMTHDTNPICAIYCASSGSFATEKHLARFVQTCIGQGIFIALVCTNMYAGNKRIQVMKQFTDLLECLKLPVQRREENGIVYFGRMALCAMVNSRQYLDEHWRVSKEPSGVEELIFGIAQCLEREKQLLWFRTVSENQTFWSTMSNRISSLLHIPIATVEQIRNYACGFVGNFGRTVSSASEVVQDLSM